MKAITTTAMCALLVLFFCPSSTAEVQSAHLLNSSVSLRTPHSCDSCSCQCDVLCDSGLSLDEINDHLEAQRLRPARSSRPRPHREEDSDERPVLRDGAPISCEHCAMENLHYVNNYRARYGLRRLSWHARYASMAVSHSHTMYRAKRLYHSSYRGIWENVAYSQGYTTWEKVGNSMFDQWKNSPGHNKNMLTASHRCAGIGIFGDGDTYYGTQIFSNNC